jgi:hypothetical protein
MVLPILVQIELQQQQYHREQLDLNFDNLVQKAKQNYLRTD